MDSSNNLLSSLIFLVIGTVTFIESYKIRILKFGSPLGGDFFPKVLSAMLIILSAIWFFISLMSWLKERDTERYSKKVFSFTVPWRVVIYIIVFVAYIFVIRLLGFIVPTIILSLITYLFLKTDFRKMDLFVGVVYSIVITLLIWFVFVKVLGLVLPAGVF